MFVMYVGPGALLWVALLVLGVIWCKEVIGRWRSDVEELRGCEDKVRKAVIVGIWAVTLLIALMVIISAGGLLIIIAKGVYGALTAS